MAKAPKPGYSARKVADSLHYVDRALERLKSRTWPGIDAYALWSKATPEALEKLHEAGAVSDPKKLAEAMDYCAEHYATWESEQEETREHDDYYEYNGKNSFKTRAAFQIKGRWKWYTWTHEEPNKHAAIIEKAKELGAERWDYGNADHAFVSEANF